MATALVFGNSHIGPYARGHHLARAQGLIGCDVRRLEFEGDRYQPQIQHTADRGLQFHPAIAEDIGAAIRELKPVCLVTAVMGSAHWIQGMSCDPRPFDFLISKLPQHPLTKGTELIPYDLMRRRYYDDFDWQFGVVRSVQKVCDLPIFHIEAPPPVESVELMLQGIAQHAPTKASMERFGLPSIGFRYKVWWACNDATRRICVELGLHFVDGPPETRDSHGFLDRRFYLDGIHGNDEYGKLMAGEVARAMRSVGMAEV